MKQEWLSHARSTAPRYTSYPTAVQFHEGIGSAEVSEWAQKLPPKAPLSVYVHVPFCQSLCWYCGCHTSIPNGYARIAAYYEVLKTDIENWGRHVGDHGGAAQVHLGGGTPNALSADHMVDLLERLHQTFLVRPDAEIAAELDPRTLSLDMIRSLAAGGVTRASLGVQDFDPVVQKAINRIQPYEQVSEAALRLRRWGVDGLSFDLLYGLPHQTSRSIRQTARLAAGLSPDRISAFGYAHVPWFAKHQRAIATDALPDLEMRFEQFEVLAETLMSEGYVPIGLDHFARSDDSLAQAAAGGRLKRNFQGYTTDDCQTLIALGPSGISAFSQGYAQSHKNISEWRSAVEAGRLPVCRGIALTEEDKVRRTIIERLMCDFTVDVDAVCASAGYPPDRIYPSFLKLAPMQQAGFCRVEQSRVSVLPDARSFVRTVAQAFDAYAAGEEDRPRHAGAI